MDSRFLGFIISECSYFNNVIVFGQSVIMGWLGVGSTGFRVYSCWVTGLVPGWQDLLDHGRAGLEPGHRAASRTAFRSETSGPVTGGMRRHGSF